MLDRLRVEPGSPAGIAERDSGNRLGLEKDEGEAAEADAPVVVPEAAVRRDDAESFVWVVEEGRVRRVAVETDGKTDGGFRVKAGLRGGEAVVTGDVTLSEGDAVTVAEPG